MKQHREKNGVLAKRIKSLFAKTELTYEELAEKAGVSLRMIYYYANGRSQPGMLVYEKINKLVKKEKSCT